MTKVLFVEDKAHLRDVIEDAFGEVGYEVAALTAGQKDLADIDASRPDLVIYDRDHAGTAATEMLDRMVRRLSGDGRQPVIVLGDRSAADLGARHGQLWLSGPLDVDALIVAAAGLLNGELAAGAAA